MPIQLAIILRTAHSWRVSYRKARRDDKKDTNLHEHKKVEGARQKICGGFHAREEATGSIPHPAHRETFRLHVARGTARETRPGEERRDDRTVTAWKGGLLRDQRRLFFWRSAQGWRRHEKSTNRVEKRARDLCVPSSNTASSSGSELRQGWILLLRSWTCLPR